MKWKFWDKEEVKNDNITSSQFNEPFSQSQQNNTPFQDPTGFSDNQFQSQNSPFSDPINPSSQPDTFNKDFAQNNNVANNNIEKDLMVINAKIDAIKAILETVNQRIIKIERIAEGETPKNNPQRQQTNSQTEYRW